MQDEPVVPAEDEPEAPREAAAEVAPTAQPEEAPVSPARRQPVWTYFLTPAAVVIGSVIIAGAIWWTSDDGAAQRAQAGPPAAKVESQPPATAASPAAAASAAAQDVKTAFTSYASQIGLDQGKFQTCMGNEQNAQLINTHLQRGVALGVNGTPTFFVNNKRIVGAQPGAIFDEVIAKELTGSPTSLDAYSDAIRQLASSNPPYFEIIQGKVDVSGASIEGNPNARVMIAEFSDFQCPFCKRWVDDNMKRIRSQLGDNVALAFLHFPIAQIHANAGSASMAAICAGEQGKFPQMHDLLFARQKEWEKLQAN